MKRQYVYGLVVIIILIGMLFFQEKTAFEYEGEITLEGIIYSALVEVDIHFSDDIVTNDEIIFTLNDNEYEGHIILKEMYDDGYDGFILKTRKNGQDQLLGDLKVRGNKAFIDLYE